VSDDEKPNPGNNPTKCPYVTADAIQKALLDELQAAADAKRRTVVAAHHPLMTKGPHSGYTDVLTHIFPARVARYYVPFYVEWLPLPVLGSAMVGIRACCSPSPQDLPNGQNRSFRAALNTTLRPEVKARLRALAGRRVTDDGELLIVARESRSQEKNRRLAEDRLLELVRRALVPPKKRLATKPSRASRERRLEVKARSQKTKRLRGKVRFED
jgi:ribosome-associated protein